MIDIGGSEGEGGGQVVRNACALSLVTGEPFRVTHIRAKRSKPGLMRQHVTAIEAACAIGGSDCEGLAVGSSELVFRPGAVVPGEYRFAVGTAGSTGLVLQTVLLPLLLADRRSRLVLEGGTHNMLAPPFEFIDTCFLPVIRRMGGQATARLHTHGFYPRGGGRIEVEIAPSRLSSVECCSRGALLERSAVTLFAALPFEIADRIRRSAAAGLGWGEAEVAVRELPEERGPGVILLLTARYEHAAEVVSGFGKLGLPAEQLARVAVQRMLGYMESTAFAGPYLADQLLLPMALAGGGAFTTVKPSQHSLTAAAIIERFTGVRTTFERQDGGEHLVRVG